MERSMFRNASGVLYTKALFVETASYEDRTHIMYTLRNKDHEKYPSLYKLYMEMEDVLEYDFANKYFEGWEHWLKITENQIVKEYVEQWRRELEIKLRAKALNEIRKVAKEGGRNSYEANKLLLDGKWKSKEEDHKSNHRGRPKKEEIIVESNRVEEDFKRLLS